MNNFTLRQGRAFEVRMSTRIAISIIFCSCIVFIKGQISISQTPDTFVEGQSGTITCTSDEDTEEVKIIRNTTPVLTCVSFNRSTCDQSTDYNVSFSGNTNVSLNILRLSRSRDEAQWRCATQNDSVTLNLDVYVPVSSVEIENKARLNFVDGISQTIRCQVEPVIVKPRPTFTWKIDGDLKYTSTSGEYIYKASKSDYNKSLECSAENNYGTAQNDTLVLNVTYKPIASILPRTSPYKIIEKQELNVTCNYEANPAPTGFTVVSPGGNYSGKEVTITIEKSHSGSFFCEITNTVGSANSTTIQVDVLYPPKIQIRSEYMVIESNPFSLKCDVDSNPQSHSINWTNSNDETLRFTNISRPDSGSYTCSATNTMVPTDGPPVTKSDNKTTLITVLYGPEVSVVKEKIEVIEFRNLRTSCRVESKPPAKIKWFSPDNRIVSLTEVLELHSVNRTNAGYYTCEATVTFVPTLGQGLTEKASKATLVTVLHVPEPPTQLLFGNSTETSICVQWEAGFNGGRDQNFIIQYSKDNKTWVDSHQIPERTNTNTLDVSSQAFSYCLQQLSPDTEYSIRIFPQNLVGRSDYVYFRPACCKPIRTQISVPVADNSHTVTGLAVGFSLVLVIAVLAILASIVLYRRLKKVSKRGSDYANTELGPRESQSYADLRQPPDGGVQYVNYGSENIGAEDLYENQQVSNNQVFKPDTGVNSETSIGKSVHSKNHDHKKKAMLPKVLSDERNYENLPSANIPQNIYENLKGKKKKKTSHTKA